MAWAPLPNSNSLRYCPATLLRGVSSEQEFDGELELPGIEHRPGRTEQVIRNRRAAGRAVPYREALDSERGGVIVVLGHGAAAEIVGAVDGVDFIDVGTIEDVERVEDELEPIALAGQVHDAREAQVPRAEVIALIHIARRFAYAIGDGIAVVIGVKADKLGERTRRLHGDNAAELEIAPRAAGGCVQDEIGDEAIANVLVRQGSFEISLLERLRSADERDEGAVIQRLREGVIGVEREIAPDSFLRL